MLNPLHKFREGTLIYTLISYGNVSWSDLKSVKLQVQGFSENFGDSCRDAISWISDENYLPSFTEGWATYVEYPLMVEDTDAYSNTQDKKVLLQKYGMLKYQVRHVQFLLKIMFTHSLGSGYSILG